MIASQRGFRRMRLILCAERIKWLVRLGSTREAEALAREIELPRDPARVLPCRRLDPARRGRSPGMGCGWRKRTNRVTEALHVAKQWRLASHPTHGARGHLAPLSDILLVQQYLLQGQECAATPIPLRSALCSAAPGRLIRSFSGREAGADLTDHFTRPEFKRRGDAAEALASVAGRRAAIRRSRAVPVRDRGSVSAHLAGP